MAILYGAQTGTRAKQNRGVVILNSSRKDTTDMYVFNECTYTMGIHMRISRNGLVYINLWILMDNITCFGRQNYLDQLASVNSKCMIKIFWGGGRGGDTFKPPSLYEQLLHLPTPCF